MKTLTVPQLNYANLGISLILLALALFLQNQAGLNGLSGLDIISGLMLIFSGVNAFAVKNIGPNLARIILSLTFVLALLLGFVPRLGGYTEVSSLFILANVVSAIWLLLLFFTKPQESK